MTTFTDKELIKEIKERIGSLDVRDNIERRAYEIALASLEADPVAYIFKHPAGKLFWVLTDESNKDQSDVIPVYAAPPVPVVPAELPENDDEDGHDIDYLEPSEVYSLGRTAGWNACRAAMLHSAEPVSQAYKLNQLSGNSPVTPGGWISCSDRMPEDTKMLLAFSQGEIVAAYWNWVVNPIDYKKYRAFTYLSGNILDDVTHWMPLPEPPL
ncbi:DUF551 domain-containing protein [Escherichia coli]|nr:DUF551 domain-containing protein [Escherichia coli]